jgi:nucleoid DNA-binding protein
VNLGQTRRLAVSSGRETQFFSEIRRFYSAYGLIFSRSAIKSARSAYWPDECFVLTHPQGGSFIMGKVAVSNAKKSPSKSEILASVSEATGVAKKDVSAVFEALGNEIKKAMGNKGPGMFAIPGLVKIEKKKVPARPARKGVPNPFKPGELMDVAAKPASTKIKVRALKQLKAMA